MQNKRFFYFINLTIFSAFLIGCTPSPSVVQTAIAKTQVEESKKTNPPISPTGKIPTSTLEPIPTTEPTPTSFIKNLSNIFTPISIEDFCRLQVIKIEFSRKILPPNTSGYYTYYEAETTDSTFFDIVIEITNLDTTIKSAEDFVEVSILYDNKYTYSSSPILVDGQGNFTMALFGIEPLLTMQVHHLISVPVEMENSRKSIEIIFKGPNQEFHYKYR